MLSLLGCSVTELSALRDVFGLVTISCACLQCYQSENLEKTLRFSAKRYVNPKLRILDFFYDRLKRY